MSVTDEMAFEPREVVISAERTFTDFYTVGEEIGRYRTDSSMIFNCIIPIFIFTRTFFIYDMNTTSVSLATTLNFINYK